MKNMETFIHITGVQYADTENDVRAVMAELEQKKPEVLLVTEQTNDYGIIVRALTGTTYRGVVSRHDLEYVLSIMQHSSTSVLVGKVADTNAEGGCYNIRLTGDYPERDTATAVTTPDIWAGWDWSGAPLMDNSPADKHLDISLKVVLAELKQSGKMDKQTLMEHLAIVLKLTKWNVSREAQAQLGEIHQLASRHPDSNIRAFATQLRHTLNAIGSQKRINDFQDTYLSELYQSTEAEQMHRKWCAMHEAELCDIRLWQNTITKQLNTIDDCLMHLPAGLCYQKDQFGPLMHRLLYLHIPHQKLLMLLSAIVLRKQLRKQLGITTGNQTNSCTDEDERRLTSQLAPYFYGNIEYAHEFLMLARGQKPSDITTFVSLWVKEKRICPAHCHRPLWTALHEAGIYQASESNWNQRLDIRKFWH